MQQEWYSLYILMTAVTSAPSLTVFRKRLKTHLFTHYFP